MQYLTNKAWLWGQYGSLRTQLCFGPYTILTWTAQSVNCILPENTCFIFYIIPNLYIKKKCLITSTHNFINQQMLNIKGLEKKHNILTNYELKHCNNLPILLCKNSITSVLADIPQQSIQSCTPWSINRLFRAFIAIKWPGDVTLK